MPGSRSRLHRPLTIRTTPRERLAAIKRRRRRKEMIRQIVCDVARERGIRVDEELDKDAAK